MTKQAIAKRRQPREKRWMPEHFPIGTIVTVNLPTSGDKSKEQVFEVARTLCNGVGSFVIESTQHDDTLDMKKSFNISWVVGIIKRGDGGSSYDHRDLGEKFRQGDGKRTQQDRQYFINYLKEDGRHMNVRGYYYGYSPSEYVRSLVYYHSPVIANTELVDYDAIAGALCVQSFVSWISMGDSDFKIFRVNNKRAKRWLKQNFRRLLRNVKFARAEEEAYMVKMYQDDLENDDARTRHRYFDDPVEVPVGGYRFGEDGTDHDLSERERALNDNIINSINYDAEAESTDVSYLVDDPKYDEVESPRVLMIDPAVPGGGYSPGQMIIQSAVSTEEKSVFKKTS